MQKSFFTALLFFTAIFFFSHEASAQKHSKKQKPVPAEVVMIPDSSAEELPIPDPTGLVSDFGNVFTKGQEDTLSGIIKKFKDSTQDEIAIVAWDTLHLAPQDWETYIKKLAESWDVGEKNKGNGIVIAFSVQLRKIHIENATGGLREKDAWDIVHKIMLPYFVAKNYYIGTLKGLKAVITTLKTE